MKRKRFRRKRRVMKMTPKQMMYFGKGRKKQRFLGKSRKGGYARKIQGTYF